MEAGANALSVSSEGEKSASVKTSSFKGQMPVHRKASMMFAGIVALGSAVPTMAGIS